MRCSLAVLATAILLGGCSFAPEYRRPSLPVPASLPADAHPPQLGDDNKTPLAEVGWQAFFTDQRLRGAIDLALRNNRDLRVAVANVAAARASYRVQRSDLLPTVSADGSGAMQRVTRDQAALYGGDRTPESWSASIGASWEIDLFGRIRNLSKAALEQYFSTDEARKAAQIALVGEVANAWLTLGADTERLDVASQSRDAFERTLGLTRARHERGYASALDVRQAQTSFEQARSTVAQLRTAVAQDRNALALLMGISPDDGMLPIRLGEASYTIDQLPPNLSSEVLVGRPDVLAAEHQLIAANANIGAARAAFFPRISLTGAVGTMAPGLSHLFESGSDTWNFSPAATLPIFNYGRNSANLAATKAQRDAAVASYEKAVQSAFREAADALARRSTIAEQLDAQQSLERASAESYQLAEARYRRGLDPFLSTLDAQRALLAAQQSLIDARLAKQSNLVDLYRVFGGGLR
ncbi:efflux transporter outer membrane subunit [Sphingobium sp. H39-3-25]|nr:efflux transporter outer membrane subunit [Sphingobium arseniciresistens]